MEKISFTVETQDNNLRLDVYLVKSFKQKYSRTFLKRLIEAKHVLVNAKLAPSHHKVKLGEKILLELIEEESFNLNPENIPLDIVYEDEDLLVINKPPSMVVHPAPGNYSGTLVNALLYHCKNLSNFNQPLRPGIVHRLDKDTSGLMLVAKNNPTHSALAKQFLQHKVKRRYVALVKGQVQFDEGIVDLPLGRSPRDREKISVSFHKSRAAKTVYRVLKRYKDRTLLELFPQTGRTHQLRVHLSYLGYPILGDEKYGQKNSFPRLALHAESISFIHPKTNELMEFNSRVPFDV
ncbi:MAG: RluA family pseudouridine synthase [Candidatus Omnitrophota bacterium]|nr:RluA family pseudouridine synthase [Candidatus Omnitrophota bacterium]